MKNEMSELNELNLDDMEQARGGISLPGCLVGGGLGTILGGVGGILIGIATGPVGWCALGGAAIGAATMGTVVGVTAEK